MGKVVNGRKAYTSMVDVVKDFWDGMNSDETSSGRCNLPKLDVKPGVGDETDAADAKKVNPAAQATRVTASFQARSMASTDIDGQTFEDMGFLVGKIIRQKCKQDDPDDPNKYEIVKMDDQDVTIKTMTGDEKTLKRCEIADVYEVAGNADVIQAALRCLVRVGCQMLSRRSRGEMKGSRIWI